MTIVRNDTKNFYVLVVDQNGEIFPLTGYTAEFTARISYTSPIAAIAKNGVISEPLTGRIDFKLLPSETDIVEGSYRYDVQIKEGTDNKYTVVKDMELVVSPGITLT